MKPLALFGQATSSRGFDGAAARAVIRLCAPQAGQPAICGSDLALISELADVERARSAGFTDVLVRDPAGLSDAALASFGRVVRMPARFDYLGDGDILGLEPVSRRFRVMYRRDSRHNSFLVTERCNHYCLMCSQPPRDVDDRWILDEIEAALPLVDPATDSLGFTGGEPLLEWERFVGLLEQTRDVLPATAIQVLTNGRALARREVVDAWAKVNHPSLYACIPLYGAVDHIHDYVVQSRGAFDETVLGIMRLKDKGQRVEVRVVLQRVTTERLVETCAWIARNLAFVDHVALMGLENTGFALANPDLIWVDPVDYRAALAEGVEMLASVGLRVSVYNLPLCVLDRRVWPFAVRSISDWKNAFVPECDGCVERPRCGGFFSTGRPRISRGVHAILPAGIDPALVLAA